MDFVRIKEDLIRLDMVTRIREGKNEETFYGRSVRKGTEAWLEVYFIGGEVLRLEGESAVLLRRYLEQSGQVRDVVSLLGDGRVPGHHAQAHPHAQHQAATAPQPPGRPRGPHG